MKAPIRYRLAVVISLAICIVQTDGNANVNSTPVSSAEKLANNTSNIDYNDYNQVKNKDNYFSNDISGNNNSEYSNNNSKYTNNDNNNEYDIDNNNEYSSNNKGKNNNDNTLYFHSSDSLPLKSDVNLGKNDLLPTRRGKQNNAPQADRGGRKNPLNADWGGLGDAGRLSPSVLDVPWWPFFLTQVAYAFRGQRRDRKSQFGAVFMARVDDLRHFHLDLQPHNKDGTPAIDNTYKVSPEYDQIHNFVASRSEDVSGTMLHAVDRLLKNLLSLWENYDDRYNQPGNVIVLYWWIMPCPDCVELITCHLNHSRFANFAHKVLVYTEPGTPTLKYMTEPKNVASIKALNNAGIEVFKQTCDPSVERENTNPDLQHAKTEPDRESSPSTSTELQPPHDDRVCRLEDTLQGCMVDCLDRKICCSCKNSGRRAMTVALVNQIAKQCATSDIRSCAADWIKKTLDYTPASTCVSSRYVEKWVNICAKRCIDRPLSKPLLPKSPSVFPGCLTDLSDLSNLPDVDLTDFCQDIRADGFLCTTFRSDVFTAGNTMCRSDNRCGFHKNNTYSWCYVDWTDNWEYCCTEDCGFHGESYMRCKSGPIQWQECGDAGHETVDGRRCLAEFPCGLHQEKDWTPYYWCYTDVSLSWSRCCQPGTHCGESGNCYTGYKKNTYSMKCRNGID